MAMTVSVRRCTRPKSMQSIRRCVIAGAHGRGDTENSLPQPDIGCGLPGRPALLPTGDAIRREGQPEIRDQAVDGSWSRASTMTCVASGMRPGQWY
jgi:hypothetical protein